MATIEEPELQPVDVNAGGQRPEYEQPPSLRDIIEALERSSPTSEAGVYIHGNPRRIGSVAAEALAVIADRATFTSQLFELYAAADRLRKPGTITLPRFVPCGTDARYPNHDVLSFRLRVSEDMDFALAADYDTPHDVYTEIEANFRIVRAGVSTLAVGASLAERLRDIIANHRATVAVELDTDVGFVATGAAEPLEIAERTVLASMGARRAAHANTFNGRAYLIKCAADAVNDSSMITQSATGRYMLKRGFVDLGA